MPRARSTTLRVGVTGGIGSGKTAVCRILQRRGFTVLWADSIARTLSDTDPAIRRRLTRLLGPEAYTRAGTLHRPFVARKIFSSRRLQRAVNSIVHPRVERFILNAMADVERRRKPVVIVEAALIFEAGLDRHLDLVVLVDADVRSRLKRLARRDGTTQADIRRRMRAQWDVRRKRRRADIILRNTGSLADLRAAVRSLARLFHTLAGARSA